MTATLSLKSPALVRMKLEAYQTRIGLEPSKRDGGTHDAPAVTSEPSTLVASRPPLAVRKPSSAGPASKLPRPAPSSPPPAPAANPDWRAILKTCPPRPAPPVSPEQWAVYNAALTPKQRNAQRHRWYLAVMARLARAPANKGREAAAAAFAWNRRAQIKQAFDRGERQKDVLAELQQSFAGAKTEP